MNPVLKKRLDEIVTELAEKRFNLQDPSLIATGQTPLSLEKIKSYYALVAQQSVLMAKLAILGSSAKDKNINIKESCQLMMVDVSAFGFHGIAILGLAIEEAEVIGKEVDDAVIPVLQQLFQGPIPGKDQVN